MARILWIADGGCSTGFGRVTHALGDRLVDLGHEIHVLAVNYKGDPFDTKVKLYPPNLNVQSDTYGFSRVLELLDKLRPDLVFMLNDPQVLAKYLFENRYDPQFLLASQFQKMIYVPVDGYEMPSLWAPVFAATVPVAMSKFGQNQIPNASLVYHGVDTDQFWQVSKENPVVLSDGTKLRSKRECKKAVGLPADSFVVGRVDRNTGRKDYGALWKALVPLMKRHSDMVAYFHCRKNESSGVNIDALLSRDSDTSNRFFLPAEFDSAHGYVQQDLNAVYNSFDVFVSTSRGEGFGLTIAEALACGVPVIAQNVSSIPEVVGPGGELIEPERPITVPFGQDQMLANVGAFTEAIEHAYSSRGWRREKGKAGRDHVASQFRWDEAADRFHEYIEGVLARGQDDDQGGRTPGT